MHDDAKSGKTLPHWLGDFLSFLSEVFPNCILESAGLGRTAARWRSTSAAHPTRMRRLNSPCAFREDCAAKEETNQEASPSSLESPEPTITISLLIQ
jgi:hypothetical protein